MIPLLVPAIALLVWTLLAEPAQGWLFLLVWAASSWLILAGSLESARLRRRVWLDQYLLADSRWHQLLRGGVLMTSWHLLIAALLALFMLARLLNASIWLWLILLAQIPLIWLLGRWMDVRLGAHVKPEVRPAVTRRLLVPLTMLPLLLCYLLLSLNLSQPHMGGIGWGEAVDRYLPDAQSAMALLALVERLYLLLDLTLQWALQNTLGSMDDSGALALLAWSLLLIGGAAFAWAWVRMLVGVGALFPRQGDAR
ncbi:hypothetical protein [Halopseudomonas sp.]|uniref:hypothetical protein n=1 Tax=Halopseudomonas sp. TaxID=2901191 RepID=UPI00356B4A3D